MSHSSWGWVLATPSTRQGPFASCTKHISADEGQLLRLLRVWEKRQVALTFCRYKHFILTMGVLSTY